MLQLPLRYRESPDTYPVRPSQTWTWQAAREHWLEYLSLPILPSCAAMKVMIIAGTCSICLAGAGIIPG